MEKEIFIYNQKYSKYIDTINNIEFSILHLPDESEFNYIKSFEFIGIFEKFAYLSIDG